MNRAMMTRLSALEGVAVDPVLIVRVLVDADQMQGPEAFTDGRGNKWVREPGEDSGSFRDRAVAGAAARGVRVISARTGVPRNSGEGDE